MNAKQPESAPYGTPANLTRLSPHAVAYFTAVTFFAVASAANGGTYYVRATGNNSNSGTSAAQAWRTAAHAANHASAGDTVFVGAGTYSGQVRFHNDGTSGSPIQLIADSDGAQTGDGGDVVLTAPGTETVLVQADYVELIGFKIAGGVFGAKWDGSSGNPLLGGLLQNCDIYSATDDAVRVEYSTLNIVNCIVRETADDGIDLDFDCQVTITGTTVQKCNSEGVDANEATSNLIINQSKIINNGGHGVELLDVTCSMTNCLVAGNGGEGIYAMSGAPTTLSVWHCTIAHNGDEGIDIWSGNVNLHNSICVYNGDDGIAQRSGTTINHSYNLVYGNADLQYNGTSASTGEISANPRFIDTDDYRLGASSPAIDAGTDGSAKTNVDMDGNARPADGGWDMGCYEGAVQLRFSDVSAAAGFNVQTASDQNMASALHWGDLDNDGDLDVIITGSSSARRLLQNGATKTFTASTFDTGDVRRQGALVDLDNDGDLDFAVVNVGNFDTERFYLNDGSGAFTSAGNLGMGAPDNNEGLAIADVNHDGWADVVMFSGDANWIGINQATSPPTLQATTDTSYGLNDAGDFGNGYFVSSADVNNDGYVDFFYHYNNGKLFLSDGDGTYTENAMGISVATISGSSTDKSGSAWGDYDNDGDLDLFVARYDSGQKGYLWRNDGSSFTNVTTSAGITDTTGQRSGAWGDYDNDGDLDLYVVTRGSNANVLYQNQGDGTFQAVQDGAGATGSGHDAVFVDYDNDGDLDLSVTQENATNTLLRNNTDDTNYLEVRVTGGGAGQTNSAAIGARVELYAANGTTFLARRDVGGSAGYGGAAPQWVHFGGVTPNQTYVVKVFFANSTVATSVVPAAVSSIIGATSVPQMLTVEEAGSLVVKNWRTTPSSRRQDALRQQQSAPGWTPPTKDLNHLSGVDQD